VKNGLTRDAEQNNCRYDPTSNLPKGDSPMMKLGSGLARTAIERVLELSADAQIARREVGQDSPAFDSLTGKIAAYGKVLALLTALQKREEFFAILGNARERVAA
jgi:hypothetical protein